MKRRFNRIALLGLPREPAGLATHNLLYNWLTQLGYSTVVEQQLASLLGLQHAEAVSLTEIGTGADLAIVVGGDGNMLCAARQLAQHEIVVVGVNRGNLGFLTDLNPGNLQEQLTEILAGNYTIERRFLLKAEVKASSIQPQHHSLAANEVVLHSGGGPQLIEFEVDIDGNLAFSQRADGLIIATPTGSTAYALSAGGPIINPLVNAILLLPMFAHSVSVRPLVISDQSSICLRFSASNTSASHKLAICCDGQVDLELTQGESVSISKSQHHLNLLHPSSYNYFSLLRAKLGWSKIFP